VLEFRQDRPRNDSTDRYRQHQRERRLQAPANDAPNATAVAGIQHLLRMNQQRLALSVSVGRRVLRFETVSGPDRFPGLAMASLTVDCCFFSLRAAAENEPSEAVSTNMNRDSNETP